MSAGAGSSDANDGANDGGADDIDDRDAQPPRLAPLGLQHDPVHVLGFPLHVALTIASADAGASFRNLPPISFFSLEGAVGFVLFEAATGQRRAAVEPKVRASGDPDEQGLDLPAGEAIRVLVDLSPLVPVTLPPGDYRLVVSYVTRVGRPESAPVALTVREPTSIERDVLRATLPERSCAGSWSEWCRLPPVPPADPEAPVVPLRGPFSHDDPLRYCRVLRYLFHGEDDLADVDPATLGVLDGLYQPEAGALRIEIIKARGDDALVSQLSNALLAATPGLAWWVKSIAEGRSDLQWANEARRQARARRQP